MFILKLENWDSVGSRDFIPLEPFDFLPPANIMAETFSCILIMDWRRLQDPTAKSKGLDDLREAIFVVGFLYLTNHGLEVRSLTFRSMLANKSRI